MVVALQRKHGERALRKGIATSVTPPAIPTGFPTLDDITGCRGIPRHAITILSGRMTSGKVTLAYKILAAAQDQHGRDKVAILDLNSTTDPDYLARCGVDLERLVQIRPTRETALVQLLLDLIRTNQLRLILVDSLPDLAQWLGNRSELGAMGEQLNQALR
ncbi:MAG: hypothetical protein KDF65_09730, partial [Anaerolineae bacterium]|nr:hypothetical protein [Anaerolineae bacterium]